MVVDIHAHPGFAGNLKGLREEFAPALRAASFHGVDRVCLNSLGDWTRSPKPNVVKKANDAVLSLAADHPKRVIGFCYVNPTYPEEALKEIERCVVGEGMAGIKLWTACRASDDRVRAIAQRAAALGIPLLQHAWYEAGGNHESESTPADVAVLARRCPEAHIVMAHLTGAGEQGLADIAPHRNVSVDISGGEPEAGLLELAVRRLGARRVMFGTDSPIRSYGMTLGKVRGAKITRRQRELILGGNARRLLAGRLEP